MRPLADGLKDALEAVSIYYATCLEKGLADKHDEDMLLTILDNALEYHLLVRDKEAYEWGVRFERHAHGRAR